MIAWDIVLQLVEVKPMKKNFGGLKFGPKFGFWNFLKVALLVFLDIAQDCSLRQCLTSSRAEISDPNWGRNDLFYSNVVERALKYRNL